MNELEAHEMDLYKRQILEQQGGRCGYCGDLIKSNQLYDIAHKLAKHKWRLEKYGLNVIHHRLNVTATHKGNCNDLVMVNIEKFEGKELLTAIFNDLCLDLPDEFLK